MHERLHRLLTEFERLAQYNRAFSDAAEDEVEQAAYNAWSDCWHMAASRLEEALEKEDQKCQSSLSQTTTKL